MRSERGQSLISSALVFLAAFLMLTAILDLGQLMLFIGYFSERTRSVARYAAVHEFDEAKLREMASGFMGVTPAMVSVTRHDGLIEVSIHDYPLRFLSPLMAGGKTPRAFRSVAVVEENSPQRQ
jgi:hypothetical protein